MTDQTPAGCCQGCYGTGRDGSAPETNGLCWDCRGTGHPHAGECEEGQVSKEEVTPELEAFARGLSVLCGLREPASCAGCEARDQHIASLQAELASINRQLDNRLGYIKSLKFYLGPETVANHRILNNKKEDRDAEHS